MIANNSLCDKITSDLFSNFSYTGRKIRIYDVNPDGYAEGKANLKSFPAAPLVTIPISSDTIVTIDGKKYVEFRGTSLAQTSTEKVRTAYKWFTIVDVNGDFIYGGRVGTFIHGMALRTEFLFIEDGITQELNRFQFRFEME